MGYKETFMIHLPCSHLTKSDVVRLLPSRTSTSVGFSWPGMTWSNSKRILQMDHIEIYSNALMLEKFKQAFHMLSLLLNSISIWTPNGNIMLKNKKKFIICYWLSHLFRYIYCFVSFFFRSFFAILLCRYISLFLFLKKNKRKNISLC